MIDNGLIFDIRIAEKYSVEEAIVIAKLFAWIKHNALNGKNYHDGRYWTFNSLSAFAKYFPFWSESKVKRILIDLYGGIDKKDTQPKHEQIILKGNFNKNPYDKTVWYSFTDDFFKYLLSLGYANLTHFPKSENGVSEIDQSDIPIADEQYQYNKTKKEDNNTPLTPQGGEQGCLFPDEEEKPKKSKKTISFSKELIALGVEPQFANDWIRVRQTKRATQTDTAWEHVKRNLEKIQSEYGIPPNDAIRICAEQSWSGCEVRFFRNIGQEQNGYNQQQTNDPDTYEYDRNGNKIKKQIWQ